ncbi:MAG: tagatose 1,6-diphosphate aldolase [Candidatus Aenigmatarchaeota archaeon]
MNKEKIKCLKEISDKGLLKILAVDHRGSMERLIKSKDRTKISKIKKKIVSVLSPYSSATLLDPVYGKKAFEDVSGGLLISREKTGYTENGNGRKTELLENLSIKKIKEMGASTVKLLIYYNPKKRVRKHQEKLVKKVAEKCEENNIPFLCEVLLYSIKDDRNNILIDSAKKISKLGIDILKTEAPNSFEDCKKLNEEVNVPWVVLSGGISYQEFKVRVREACKAGASGYAGGRGIWKECVKENGIEECLVNKSVPRIEELNKIVEKYGQPSI